MHAPSFTVLRRLRRLNSNDLGPKGGMAFAKALESNAAIKELQSAALPLNPLAHAQLHASCVFNPFLVP